MKVVVVGHGMVGSRFVDELLRRDVAQRFSVTVLGAEPYEPYNRVLLSEVVAGTVGVASLALPVAAPGRAVVRTGTAATSLDRVARTVLADDGTRHPYDVLVLATGAAARVPGVPGLLQPDGGTVAGAHPLRTLDDAREVVAASVNARRAVVLGAGVLGLEAACGLAGRGLGVTVVHAGPHLMERQLAAEPADVVAGALARSGVAVRTASEAQEVHTNGGRLTALTLADGEVLPCDLLVLACGTVAETALAAAAGLRTDRGVVVGPDLRCPDDPAVLALGDCAQPPGGSSGLVAQGWDQARRLAAGLVAGLGAAAPPDAGVRDTSDVVRLKGAGMDVLAFGVTGGAADPAAGRRAVRLSDPGGGRHVEVVVEGDRLVGATCVGAGALGADLTSAYVRGTPVPADPAQLVLRPVGVGAPSTSPTLMPERTTVCRCNGVTKGDVVGAWRGGARDVGDVAAATRATTGCGSCRDVVCGLLEWLAEADPDPGGAPASQTASSRTASSRTASSQWDARHGESAVAAG